MTANPEDIKALVERLTALAEKAKAMHLIHPSTAFYEPDMKFLIALHNAFPQLRDALTEQAREIEGLRAKRDALMLEYCPQDMTPEQRAGWTSSQRRTTPGPLQSIPDGILQANGKRDEEGA